MRVVLLVLVLFVGCMFMEPLVIDDFTVGANDQSIEITLSKDLIITDNPIIQNSYLSQAGSSASLLGEERDMEVKVQSGLSKRQFSSDIFRVTNNQFPAEWAVSNPKTSIATYSIQYDGMDQSFSLDIDGLGGVNLLDYGDSLMLYVYTNYHCSLSVMMFSSNGAVCTANVKASYTVYDGHSYYVPLKSFEGSCSFTDIGAIQVDLVADDSTFCCSNNGNCFNFQTFCYSNTICISSSSYQQR